MTKLSKVLIVLGLSTSIWLETGSSSSEEASEASVSSSSTAGFQESGFSRFHTLITDVGPGLRASPSSGKEEKVVLLA